MRGNSWWSWRRGYRCHWNFKSGDPSFGILRNKYLLERAEFRDFKSSFSFHDDGSMSYTSALTLKLAATGKEMVHTDRNTLHKVG